MLANKEKKKGFLGFFLNRSFFNPSSLLALFLTLFNLLTLLTPMQLIGAIRHQTQQEIADYEQLFDAEVRKQQEIVQDLTEQLRQPPLLPALKIKWKQAQTMLDVKQTLVGNFKGTPVLKSALFCSTLLSVLKKENIDAADLNHLQRTANEQRTLLKATDLNQAKK